jgi:thiol-disulfide isomerase/thioredoxin
MKFSITKHVLLIVLILQGSTAAFSQSKGIKFETGTFTEVKAKAKKQKKLIFMDCYTTWCGPCTAMTENTFPDPQAGEYFNKYFINAKFDMEKGEGKALALKYEIQCYPNLLILDADGNVLHRAAGFQEVEELIEFAKTAQNPEKRFSTLKRKYEQNTNNILDVRNYLLFAKDNCLTADTAALKFLSLAKEEDLNNPSNWPIIYEYGTDINGKAYKHVIKNIDAFIEKHTIDSVQEYSMNVINAESDKMAEEGKTVAEFKVFIKKVREMKNPTITENDLFNVSLKYYAEAEEWEEYILYAMTEGDKYVNDNNTNAVCWVFYQHSEKQSELVKAEGWMKKYISNFKQDYDWIMGISNTLPTWVEQYNLDESDYDGAKEYIAKNIIYSQYDTYAALLFKLKKKKDAANYANLAIKVAEKYNLDASETESLLEKIEAH